MSEDRTPNFGIDCELLPDKAWRNLLACRASQERAQKGRGPYDLVLTDRHHPGMDGLDLAAAIRQENPTQAIAFFTADVHSEPVYAFRTEVPGHPRAAEGGSAGESLAEVRGSCHWSR